MAGGVTSRTVTVKVFVPALADWSEALQVTVVAPMGNVEPEAGVQVTAGEEFRASLSLAEAVKVTGAPAGPVGSTVIGAGTVTTGGRTSWMVTVNVLVAVLPDASVEVQVTVVTPMGNV